jgi:hypothetical protein
MVDLLGVLHRPFRDHVPLLHRLDQGDLAGEDLVGPLHIREFHQHERPTPRVGAATGLGLSRLHPKVRGRSALDDPLVDPVRALRDELGHGRLARLVELREGRGHHVEQELDLECPLGRILGVGFGHEHLEAQEQGHRAQDHVEPPEALDRGQRELAGEEIVESLHLLEDERDGGLLVNALHHLEAVVGEDQVSAGVGALDRELHHGVHVPGQAPHPRIVLAHHLDQGQCHAKEEAALQLVAGGHVRPRPPSPRQPRNPSS